MSNDTFIELTAKHKQANARLARAETALSTAKDRLYSAVEQMQEPGFRGENFGPYHDVVNAAAFAKLQAEFEEAKAEQRIAKRRYEDAESLIT